MVKFIQETSGSKPFLYIREEWDDKVEKTTVKTSGKVKIDSEMVILKGIETPEQLMFWLKDYEDKILHNDKTTVQDRVDILKRIVSKEAQVVVMNAISLFDKATDRNDIDSFKYHKVRTRISQIGNNTEVKKYFDENDKTYESKRLEDTINECVYRLKIKIFGADHLGLNSYIQLRRSVRAMKVTTTGIRAYDTRLSDFQDYLPRCLWSSGESRGLEPIPFSEDDKRELIESALTPIYLIKLSEIGWDIQEKPYDETISKIESLEPAIKKELENQKKIDAVTKQNTTKNGTISNSGVNKKKNGKQSQSSIPKCPICSKYHKGKCWFDGGEKGSSNNKYKHNNNFVTNKDAKQMMKTMIAESKDDGDSDSDDGDTGWRSGMSAAEQMHVLASSGNDPNDSDVEFDTDDLKKYKKQAKKWSKSNKNKRKRK
jgi:hypothetical protein